MINIEEIKNKIPDVLSEAIILSGRAKNLKEAGIVLNEISDSEISRMIVEDVDLITMIASNHSLL